MNDPITRNKVALKWWQSLNDPITRNKEAFKWWRRSEIWREQEKAYWCLLEKQLGFCPICGNIMLEPDQAYDGSDGWSYHLLCLYKFYIDSEV